MKLWKRALAPVLVLALCLSLFPIQAMAANRDFTIENGVLTWYSGSGGDVVVPDGVTEIGGYVFWNKENVESVALPDSVTRIGASAFYGCTNLKSVNIPEGVISIEDWTFSGCTSLSEVVLPDTVTSIGDCAFYQCASLTGISIPAGVTGIGEWAFAECGSLASATISGSASSASIPDSVTGIGGYAFSGCTSLESVDIPNGVTSIGECAFRDCGSLISVSIPNSVAKIGESAFENCASLTGVNIPEGVTSIDDHAFRSCTSLTEVSLPDTVTSIGYASFYQCDSLTGISIPEGVISIGEWAFSDCGSLTEMSLSENVVSIGSYAFSGCTSLTSVTIPEGSVTAETLADMSFDSIFGDCHTLEEMDSIPWTDLAQRMDTNRAVLEAWLNPGQYISLQSERMTALAREITAGLTSDYEKAKAIAVWVSEHIEYDYDYLEGRKGTTAFEPEEVLDSRLTVCAGYSKLTEALLRAAGIPALYVSGIADGYMGWDGHAWNLAFADGRWFWMDTTWGVNYFDAGTVYLSSEHCIDSSYAASNADTPSDWAQDETWEAIAAGLIPYDLQAAYRENITREEFCRLVIALVEQTVGMDINMYLASRNLTAQAVFTDTGSAQVSAAYALGIVNGTSETTFDPDGSITRQEAAAMLERTAKMLGLQAGTGAAFADTQEFAPWGAVSIAFVSGLADPVTGNAVMSGVGEGYFSPDGAYTREQAALTVLRLYHCAQS